MAQQTISLGSGPNAGDGDDLRTGGDKINDNFTELYASTRRVGQSAVQQSHTGDTTETTLASVTIPGGLMGANGRIDIDVLWSYTNSANTKTVRIKVNGTTLWSGGLTTTGALRQLIFWANRGATNSQVTIPSGLSTGFGAVSGTPGTTAIDTTSDVTLTLTGQLANSGETVSVEAFSVRFTPG